MADLLITDIVSKEAIDSVNNLTIALDTSRASFVDYASAIAQASTGASKSFNDLAQRVRAFEQQQAQMQQAQSKYNADMAALRKELASVQQQLTAAQNAAKASAQANQQAAQGAQQYAQSAAAQRNAAVETAKALEAQRAAMLANFQLDQETAKLVQDNLGTRQANLEALARTELELRNVADATAQLNKDVNAGIISEDEAIKKRAELLDRERELKVSKADLQRVLKNEEKATQEAEGSYKQLSLELARLKDAYKKLNAEERASDAGRRLLEQIQQLDTGLKGTAGTFGEHQREVGNYEQAILSALGVNNRFATSIIGMTRDGGGLQGMFTKAGAAAKSFGQTLMMLLTNPAFIAIAGIGAAGVAFKWFYDYNQGIAEATRLTKEFFGLANDQTVGLRNELQATADTFGKDYKEVLTAVDTLVSQYGISAFEASEIVRKGFQAGADLGGTFLSQINQFAPAFRDAGVNAEQLVAVISQTRSGIFNEQGMTAMQMGFKRLREMSDSTREALQGIGVDVDAMVRGLSDGSITMIDALQEVSQKLNNVGENSTEAGAVLKDVFGRQGANGGMLLAKEIGNINTELEDAVKHTGEWGEMQGKLAKSQEELNDAMSALFDVTDEGWETFITQVKIIVNEWLTKMIKKGIEVINWFIDWYNESLRVRQGMAAIWGAVKANWSAVKMLVNLIIDGFKLVVKQVRAAGKAFEGLWDMVTGSPIEGLKKIATAAGELVDNFKGYVREAIGDFGKFVKEGVAAAREGSRMMNTHLEHIELAPHRGGTSNSGTNGGGANGGGANSSSTTGGGANGGSTPSGGALSSQDAQREADKIAAILKQLNATRIQLITDEYQRERETIMAQYKERIDAVTGNSEAEIQLRENYTELMNRELLDLERQHTDDLNAIREQDLQNLIDAYSDEHKSSLDYFKMRKQLLEIQREREIYAAEQQGLDVANIYHKYNQLMMDLRQDYEDGVYEQQQRANDRMAQQRQAEYMQERTQLAEQLKQGLITREFYDQRAADIDAQYAFQETQAEITNLKKLLSLDTLTAEQRLELEKQLAAAEIALNKAKIDQIESQEQQAEKVRQERLQKAIDAVQQAQKFVSAFAELGGAIMDGQAQKLEEQQDQLDKFYEAETSRIEKLQESGAISTEEAERRKEVAEKKHAAEQAKIEKKQAELKRRQAIFDKANNIAQTIMNTAVAIMQAWKQNPATAAAQTALISALGAIQVATIMAQPIPKYAKGTESHAGGLAIVGDAGKRELVITGGKAWITPNTPTLVDLPRGAYVHPDADVLLSPQSLGQIDAAIKSSHGTTLVNVNNDYTRLERATIENANELRKLQRIVARGYNDAEYLKQYARI